MHDSIINTLCISPFFDLKGEGAGGQRESLLIILQPNRKMSVLVCDIRFTCVL